MRIRILLAIMAIAACTTGCQQYYEDRIDKLYARCDVPKMPPHALEVCLDQTHKLVAAYSSPRLEHLLQKLEQSAEPVPVPSRQVRHNEEDNDDSLENAGGYDSSVGDSSDAEADVDAYGDDPPFQPDYDTVPPREPEEPSDPN